MLDPTLLRNNLEAVIDAVQRRHQSIDFEDYRKLEARRRTLQVDTESLQAERNSRSKEIGEAKGRGEDITPLREAVATLGEQLKAQQVELEEVQQALSEFLLGLPNVPHESVPTGISENGFRSGCDPGQRAIRRHVGTDRAAASGTGAVHARCTHRRARLR